MSRFSYIIAVSAMVASFATAQAETYTWTDSQGTVHFSEDLGSVPVKYRKKLRRIDDISTKSSTTPAAAAVTKTEPDKSAAAAPKNDSSDTGMYGGKTAEQWKKELSDKEVDLTDIRKRQDELASTVNKTESREEKTRLINEYKALTTRFNELKAQYNNIVESARKSGLTVNIQQ